MGEGKSNVKSGLFVSVLVSLVSWICGAATFVNPIWVSNIQNILAQIPLVGPYIKVVPVEAFTIILSMVSIFAVATFFVNRFLGFKGIFLAFTFGLIALVLVTGMNVYDIWKAIVENWTKTTT